MTEPERRALRATIDAAKRARLEAEEEHACGHCGGIMQPNPARPTQRFCSERCRKQAWYRTERGRVYKILSRRRRRRRKGMARRPNAEIAL